MFVRRLSLTDYRSYSAAEVALEPGVSVFLGANGQGKTNLVEAIEYISTLSSHRVSTDVPLVRLGAQQAIVRAHVQASADDSRSLLLELEINQGRANRARINRAPQARARDLLGVIRTVLFAPDDLTIIKGDPADRRQFLDSLVTARWPRMAGVKSDYDRVLKQRNTLLKTMSGRHGGRPDPDAAFTLEIWDEQLANFGAELLAARLDSLVELTPRAAAAYSTIAPVNNQAGAHYRATINLDDVDTTNDSAAARQTALAEVLLSTMRARRDEEIARGVSLVGPHRDDVDLSIGPLPAKGYASHGESWSLALALRLGSFELLRSDGIEPVLILDDVFAELDVTRRERLGAAVLDAEQVLVTAAVPDDVPALLNGRRYSVTLGEVSEMAAEAR